MAGISNTLGWMDQVTGFTQTSGIVYRANGALKKLKYANGVITAYQYDADQRGSF